MSLPPPARPLRCTNPDCGLPQGGRCARSSTYENPLDDCPDLVRISKDVREPEPAPAVEDDHPITIADDESDPAPWSGRHLGLRDARKLMHSTPCRVVTVMGPYDAGKTCLLTSFFLQMANGGSKELPYVFAGSRSLHGLLTLARQASSYRGRPGEQVVDHTAKDEPEDAGAFLHLALRPSEQQDDRVIDLLLTDVPGEWFSDWATTEDERAARRLPFRRRCDGYIVLVDADALLSEKGHKIDHETSLALRRLSGAMNEWNRTMPMLLVLSKYDRVWSQVGDPPLGDAALNAANWKSLGRRGRRTFVALKDIGRQGASVRVMAASAVPRPLDQGQPISVIEPFAWMLERIDQRRCHDRIHIPVPVDARPFMAMRRENHR